jgi:predicted DNA-binding transcriptional regulator AlpA
MGNTAQNCRALERHGIAKLELVTVPAEKAPDRLLNAHEVADILGVDVSWVKNHCSRVKPFLPHVRLGGGRYAMRRFRREQILEFIDLHTYHPRKSA